MRMESSSGDEQCKNGELGLKFQRTESYPYKNMMTLYHSRPFECSGSGVGPINGCDGSDGPTTSLCNCVITDGGSGGGSVVATQARPLLQPFSHASSTFKSPNLGFINPFTAAQWQDFERQALIYKHMMASVPVPPHLLMPFPNNTTSTTTATAVPHHSPLVGGRGGTGFNLRFSNNADPEPGRCRRTDGKKWRCSRDVAPDQKYCERHMHRGRPRSRKHVEVQAEITTNNNNNNSCSVSSATLMANSNIINASAIPSGVLKALSFPAMASSASAYKEQRGSMDWMLKGGTSNQDLHHLIQMKVGSSTNGATDYQQDYQENLNLNSYSDNQHHQNSSDQYYMFLNNELGSLGDQMCSEQRQRPRQFIDAWSSTRDSSSNEANKSGISSNGKFNLSNLTLSMSGNNNAHQDGNINESQLGLGSVKSLMPLSWMNPVPAIASAPGGPLGEVLQSSAASAAAATASSNAATSRSANANVGLNLMTDNWGGSGGGGDASGSPQAPTMSSPSGVLQRTLACLSDSSGSSSPTFTAPAKTDNALHWVSHSKLQSSS
ncbi:hypothetical protein Scep_025269 [Stephania cephalantha]|uniref:Growth-regulating factor n=1 Tax=Stephania cephalantha TaxID=152367 RepID=A0AAP0EKH1_9MAGN